VGLPSARIERAYLADQAAHLANFLGGSSARVDRGDDAACSAAGQIGFHEGNSERMERIHHRLHALAMTLFGITALDVAFHLTTFLAGIEIPRWSERWMILTAAFLPALGAALASINNLGEFARLHRRSAAMAQGLSVLAERLQAARRRSVGPSLAELAEIAVETAEMMVDETVDWRIVVVDLPHAAG
jgi:hypothetical protein